MAQNELERRDYFQMQAEFRGLVHQQFAELRGDLNRLENQENQRVGKLEDKFSIMGEQFAGWKVRVSLLGAVACAIAAAIAVLYMLLKG